MCTANSPWRNTLQPSSSSITIHFPKTPTISIQSYPDRIWSQYTQFSPDPDDSPPLSGALLYFAHAVDNKLLHNLSDIGIEQEYTTCCTNNKINQLLDYCATNPNNGIT
eukprot:CCRYP_004578-RA/>CCRYP_004578-RA protein AED:0.63 eAED:0.63 QI:0/-1/0/1/-1/1/1/0/108